MSTCLYTTSQVRAFDRHAIDVLGIAGYVLMQRAARAAWRVLRARWPQARRIVVVCGVGNNGGDGYLFACTARAAGLDALVVALGFPNKAGDAAHARAEWLASGGTILEAGAALPHADVYVDALFGSGLSRAVDGGAQAVIDQLNASAQPILALDVPSGIDANSGNALGVAIHATVTVTFVAHKRGLFTGTALDCCGDVLLDTLELPQAMYESTPADAMLLDKQRLRALLPRRPRNAHKGLYGQVLAIGGNVGMGGAIRLCAEAALRVGAGLVSVATRGAQATAINAARPELMVHAVDDARALAPLLDRASVLALGPGLGQDAWSRTLWQAALAADHPCVIDADGLNLLASVPQPLAAETVSTPHPGEAARLLGCTSTDIARDRFAAVRALAARFGAVTVLKGAGSLIAHPDGAIELCPWGNPGMASGGMGDVLTGAIAGLLAQGLNAWDAARCGVALHAQAGDAAAQLGEAGMLASDLFPHLHKLRNAWVGDV